MNDLKLFLSRHNKHLLSISLINQNALDWSDRYLVLTVGIGEFIAVYVVGGLLYFPLKKAFEKIHLIKE